MPWTWSIEAPVEYKFNREITMKHLSRSRIPGIVFAALAVSLAWLTTARADDVLDRGVSFHIAASPLASALIEFSTQSGVQVAVSDAQVSQLRSNGVDGTYPVHDALTVLLRGTGLEFSRVGVAMIAIRNSPVRVAAASTIRSGNAGATATLAAAKPAQPDSNGDGNSPADLPDVTVTAPRPPSDQELAGDSLYQFIVHHATTPYSASVAVRGSLTRWRGGRSQTICPQTVGLEPAYNDYVSARLRALAANVGAPVQPDSNCKENVQIVFTTEPDKLMQDVYKRASSSLRTKYPDQPKKMLERSGTHAIQGWYITAGGGGRILNADVGLLNRLDFLPLWPLVIQTGLHGAGCCYSGIVSVILVVDTTKTSGYSIASIADYMAVLALTFVQGPDHCDPLPSILDLMSSSCGARERPSAVTAGDLAFLKALYYQNTGLGPTLSRDEIQTNMTKQFKGEL
jgi:Secretin and TonB N terminus short domain